VLVARKLLVRDRADGRTQNVDVTLDHDAARARIELEPARLSAEEPVIAAGFGFDL